MNVVLIMSGGIGARFGAMIPKQYNLLEGRPVIDYVIDAVRASEQTERAVIVMDPQWADWSGKIRESGFDLAPNGETRIQSLYNGLCHISERYACDKVVIVDAVRPFLYAELIDRYFDWLDQYDAVITAQKITGGLTDRDDSRLDRDRYIITQSPEAFRFPLLWENFDLDFPYQETAGMLPDGSRRYYCFDFTNNLKLTYDFELVYASSMLRSLGKLDRRKNDAFFDKSLLMTAGIRSHLLRIEREKTLRWLDRVYAALPGLIDRWSLTSFLPNQTSEYGLVLLARSQTLGNVVLKFIPEFVGRFQRELEALRILPKSYMCGLLDVDEDCGCMLLQQIVPARFASFDENLKLTELFRCVIEDAVPYDPARPLCHIPDYLDELREKLDHADRLRYCRKEIEPELRYAVELYEATFGDARRYILHGDLHELNILDDGERFWGIDPNGMLGPIELECARYIRNDVRGHPSFGYAERFRILLESFGRFVDIQRLARIFTIDMAFTTYNSVFEQEDPSVLTYPNLELIRVAKDWMASHPADADPGTDDARRR